MTVLSFGIVILNYMKFDYTINCIELLKDINYDNFFVVIVDNMSPNESVKEIKEYIDSNDFKFKIEIIQSDRNGGYSYGNNIGAKRAIDLNADYLIIMNNDIEFTDNEILNSINSFISMRPNVAVIGPRIIKPSGLSELVGYPQRPAPTTIILNNIFYPLRIILNKVKIKKGYKNQIKEVFSVSGAFIVINAGTFEKIHYFDEKVFLFGEEIILGEKMLRANEKVLFAPDIKVIHNHSKTIGSIFKTKQIQSMQLASQLYYFKEYRDDISSSLLLVMKLSAFIKIYFWIPIIKILKNL